jgi:hypothetical protein
MGTVMLAYRAETSPCCGMSRLRVSGAAVRTIAVALALLGGTRQLGAQGVVAGRALDDSTGASLSRFPIRLLAIKGTSRIEVDAGRTGRDGTFQLKAPSAGLYQVQFGLETAVIASGPIDSVANGATVTHDVAVSVTRRTAEHPLEESQVETPARWEPLGPQPVYPSTLKYAHLAGDVEASLVVSSTGRVVAGSVRIVQATDPAFGAAVLAWLTRDDIRFRVALIGDVAVTQHVIQPMHFSVPK